jgi:hypothetical protein
MSTGPKYPGAYCWSRQLQVSGGVKIDRTPSTQFASKLKRMSLSGVRRENATLSGGCKPHPVIAPTGSSRSSYRGDEIAEAFGKRVRIYGDSASVGLNAGERGASLKKTMRRPTRTLSGKADTAGMNERSTKPSRCARGSGDSTHTRKAYATRETPRCSQG